MYIPLVIRGRVKLDTIEDNENFPDAFMEYFSSALIDEGASVDGVSPSSISFSRPFIIFEFNWKPLSFISDGTIDVVHNGFSDYALYKLNFIYLFIVASILCLVFFFIQLSNSDFSGAIINSAVAWVFIVAANIFFSMVRFSSFLNKKFLMFQKES